MASFAGEILKFLSNMLDLLLSFKQDGIIAIPIEMKPSCFNVSRLE
jgi:hypothetical protein